MATVTVTERRVERAARPAAAYRPGDLVTTAVGYPVLYEVLALDPSGLVRVRGMNWAPGYSATVSTDQIRPVTGILAQPKT
jgi:hypothetical protein